MAGSIKEAVTELAAKFHDLYKELVTNTAKFEELHKYVKENLDEFKRLIERLSDKIENNEKDRIKNEAELSSKITVLEARINALSEQAFHAVAREAATQAMEKYLQQKKSEISELTNDKKIED